MAAKPAVSPPAARVTTRSAIVARNVTGHHLLVIEGYSLTKELFLTGNLAVYYPSFSIGDRLWYIAYYPNGVNSEDGDFISLFLYLVGGSDKPVNAVVTYSLLDQAGNPVPSHIATTREYEYCGKGYGIHRFIKREFLENSEHLKNDRFTIKCDIAIGERTVVPPSDLHQHLGHLLISQEGADVTFQVAGETFRAHRYILASRSPVFKAEFFGSMRESNASAPAVEIRDMEAQVFRALLEFFYTDALPEMTPEEEPVICQHLFVAADRYGMDRLKLMCEDRLRSIVDVASVSNILALAEQYCCHGLRKTCIRFLESPEALDAVLAMPTDDFECLCRSCPSVFKELFFS
ncbi:hypothetical protein PR202_gb08085 [Eleusine coracana subsp. coracana]|uniref:Uncharacterized protein n=1 Tax=Eleusine coracana subsp. coracana TaxID=191504 RepID=A0AAV5EDT3_ELECO|nr:hypothetical protein QOZ80_2BG0180840 [Eleusine coracana subsp. coracana]GJN20682.1 hypothetical protein PR202_gb08085 [Eleusine coracana subsp. coracana]